MVALNKGYILSLKACEARQRWRREQTVLRLQLDALQAERDGAEQDLAALYDLHVRAAQAQTSHMLQVSGDGGCALGCCHSWLTHRLL